MTKNPKPPTKPTKYTRGPHFKPAMMGRFNAFIKSVVLRISEARDLGEVDRFKFYDHTKPIIAAPPDVLPCDEKHIAVHSVLNVVGVIITTNHKTDGIYLPADDRRHYVAWSDTDRGEFDVKYWDSIWTWYKNGGIEKVAAYLKMVDLSWFNPKAPPKKTKAFWHIVDAARAPEDTELADIIEALNEPEVITLEHIISGAESSGQRDFADWLKDKKNRRAIPHRLETAGYEPVRHDSAKDGLWKVNSRRQVIYGKISIGLRAQIVAAQELVGGGR